MISFGISDVFSLLMIFIIIYVTQYYYHYFTRPNPLPGPFPLPILGNIHQKIGFEQNDWYESLHKKYGDMFEIHFAGIRMIVLCRTDLTENLNAPSTKTKYPFRRLITSGFIEYGANGFSGVISNIDYKSWKYNRQFFTQAMMTPHFNYQAIEWMIELWEEMESYWNKLGEDKELDLIKWMRRFTNEMIFRISTGVKRHTIFSYYSTLIPDDSLSDEEKEKAKESETFIQSLETFLGGAIYFIVLNKFVRHYVPFIRGKIISLLKNRDYLYGRIYDIINKRRIEIENTPLDQPLRHDMLTSFITANTPRDINVVKHADADLLRPMTDKEILANIIDAISAGTDTTANTVCFVVYYLEHYPEVKQRLRREFETVFGKNLTKPITPQDLDKLRYCEAVIKEVNRHCPVTFILNRVNVEKDDVGGFTWPVNTTFQMLYYTMMKRKDYWTDPEKFDPDRFYMTEESDKYLLEKQHIKNSYHLFGGGIRICPGRKLAMIELKCLLFLIYRKYDIEMADMNEPLKYKSMMLTTCKELIVKIKPRNDLK